MVLEKPDVSMHGNKIFIINGRYAYEEQYSLDDEE